MKKCKFCGTEITTGKANKRYCNSTCRSRYSVYKRSLINVEKSYLLFDLKNKEYLCFDLSSRRYFLSSLVARAKVFKKKSLAIKIIESNEIPDSTYKLLEIYNKKQ